VLDPYDESEVLMMDAALPRDLALAAFLRRAYFRPFPLLPRRHLGLLGRAIGDVLTDAAERGFLTLETSTDTGLISVALTREGFQYADGIDIADIVTIHGMTLSLVEEYNLKFTCVWLLLYGSATDGRNELARAWGNGTTLAHFATCGIAVDGDSIPELIPATAGTDGTDGKTGGLKGDLSCRCSYGAPSSERTFPSVPLLMDVADGAPALPVASF